MTGAAAGDADGVVAAAEARASSIAGRTERRGTAETGMGEVSAGYPDPVTAAATEDLRGRESAIPSQRMTPSRAEPGRRERASRGHRIWPGQLHS